ncbi:MAG: Nramp family divalent metal transporter [Armatimonadetes bacterium]|nr:Nramp family divalent metal transporter [Armatimonadota bacterium]
MRRLGRYRLLAFLAVVGPGIITSAADNDAGGVITYTQAGAMYRYDLLWVIIVITFALAMIQEMCARMGVVTQKGLGELIRENFGVKWTMFALSTLLIANLGVTVAEFAGIAVSLEIFGLPRYITVPVAAIVIWMLVVKGTFKIVEKVFMGIAVLYATYIVSGILARPDWGEVFRNIYAPDLNPAKLTPQFLFLTIAVIGTTITPWMQFFLQATVVDKGIRSEDYVYQKLDVFVGSFMTDLVSFFMIVAAAVMIHDARGGPVAINNAAEAAAALKPVAHGFAEKLFAIGLLGASTLAAAVVPLSTAYTYSEAFGWEIGISRKFSEAPVFYGVYTFSILFGAIVVLLPNVHLVNAMINAQAVNGILLPVILVFMLKLVNRKDVMGCYTNSRIYNIAVWAMAIVLILMTLGWLVGLALGY